MSSEIDFLVKVRDAAAMVMDACETRLETLGPAEARARRPESWSDKVWSWDPARQVWGDMKGKRGPYQKADAEHNGQSIDFQNMVKDLEEHQGSLTRAGQYYWKFSQANQPTVGRKTARR